MHKAIIALSAMERTLIFTVTAPMLANVAATMDAARKGMNIDISLVGFGQKKSALGMLRGRLGGYLERVV